MVKCVNKTCGLNDLTLIHGCQHWNTMLYSKCKFIDINSDIIKHRKEFKTACAAAVIIACADTDDALLNYKSSLVPK